MSRRFVECPGPWQIEDRVFEEDAFFVYTDTGDLVAKVYADGQGGATPEVARQRVVAMVHGLDLFVTRSRP